MKTVFLISTEKDGLVKTVVSLEENSVKANKYIVLVNNKTSEQNKQIVKSLSGKCCGKNPQRYENEGYEVITVDNFIIVQNDNVSGLDLMNYSRSNLVNEYDIIFTATSGTVFSKEYIEKFMNKFSDESIGLVYSDYLDNGIPVYLQYIQPMLSSPIKIKEFAVRKSIAAEIPFKYNSFDFTMDLFNISIIRHIPEEIYAT